jgi:hypothetical protein
MDAQVAHNISEYRNLPLTALIESPTNPRRRFDQNGLAELATGCRLLDILDDLIDGGVWKSIRK